MKTRPFLYKKHSSVNLELMNPRPKKLYKSQTDKVIAGVCGGIAEYFNIDPIIVRIAFVVATFLNGLGILAYIILLIALPEANSTQTPKEAIKNNANEIGAKIKDAFSNVTSETNGENAKKLWGILLLVAGAVFLLANFEIDFGFDFWRFWPVIIIAFGIYILIKRDNGTDK